MNQNNNSNIPVVIMAGGLGTRAQSIASDIPKPLITIDGKPILQWEIECLISQGYKDIILTVSYKAEQIQSFFGDGQKFGCNISYYNETIPLGNAGALFKLYESGRLEGDFFLLNADSLFDIDFNRFYRFHQEHNASVSLFVHPNNHPYDSGLIVTDSSQRVVSWLTKEDDRPKWYKNCVNAGLHIINTSILQNLIDTGAVNPDRIGTTGADGKVVKVDLDRQILKPLCTADGKVYAYSSPEYVKDMGTPERFEQVRLDLSSGLVASRNLRSPQKAIFLDRDGTINRYNGFVREPSELELIDSAAEAIRLINQSGYLAIVITNQPVIARGEVTYSKLDQIHCKMETELGKAGAYIDGIYICPHHPDSGFAGEVASLKVTCDCRKPKPGLILRAASDLNIDLEESVFIGDSWRDVKAGQSAGCKTVFLNGAGTESEGSDTCGHDCVPDMICDNLLDAVEGIL